MQKKSNKHSKQTENFEKKFKALERMIKENNRLVQSVVLGKNVSKEFEQHTFLNSENDFPNDVSELNNLKNNMYEDFNNRLFSKDNELKHFTNNLSNSSELEYENSVFKTESNSKDSLILSLKQSLHEKEFELNSLNKKLLSYSSKLDNFESMKQQMIELKDYVSHFRNQFETVKSELLVKNNIISETEQKLDEVNKQLSDVKKDNSVLIKQILSQGELIKTIKDEKATLFNQSEKKALLKRRVLELTIELNSIRIREKSLKELIEKKDALNLEYMNILKEKDEKIALLSEQQDLIRMGVKASDESNTSLLSKVHSLEEHVSSLNQELKKIYNEKEEFESHSKMLLELNDKSVKQRLRDMALAESRKEIVLNMKIQELKSLVSKQKNIIDSRDAMLKEMLNSVAKKASDIDVSKESLNYSALENDDDLMRSREEASKIESGEGINVAIDSDITSLVHSALLSGEHDEIIISNLRDKGYEDKIILTVLKTEKQKLHMDSL